MANVTRDAELDYYKRQPLGALLQTHFGFVPKNPKPKLTKYGDVDAESFARDNWKIQCYRANSGHYMWKSHDGSLTNKSGGNSGTIVDIVFRLEGNLGSARQRLRIATGYSPDVVSTTSAPFSTSTSAPPPSPLNQISTGTDAGPSSAELYAAFCDIGPEWSCIDATPAYLVKRGLDELHPLFSFSFRVSIGRHANCVFPYWREDGGDFAFAGAEAKNADFKGYSEGGRTGIWIAAHGDPQLFVVTENPIDAMSYARMLVPYDEFNVGFMALRSGSEALAADVLRKRVEKNGLKQIYLATDNDSAGIAYASKVMAALRPVSDMCKVLYHAPAYRQNDWTDALAEHLRRRAVKAGQEGRSPGEVDPRAGIDLGGM